MVEEVWSPVFAPILHPNWSNGQSDFFVSLLQVPPKRNISWICRHPRQFGLSVYLWRDLGGSQELEWGGRKAANLGSGSSRRGLKQACSDAICLWTGIHKFLHHKAGNCHRGTEICMTALPLKKVFEIKTNAILDSPWAVGTKGGLWHVEAPYYYYSYCKCRGTLLLLFIL